MIKNRPKSVQWGQVEFDYITIWLISFFTYFCTYCTCKLLNVTVMCKKHAVIHKHLKVSVGTAICLKTTLLMNPCQNWRIEKARWVGFAMILPEPNNTSSQLHAVFNLLPFDNKKVIADAAGSVWHLGKSVIKMDLQLQTFVT